MSLSLYKQKRDFKKTAEPVAKEKPSKGNLRFVIQKHDASHVHYDLRLEMEGVLKSWAVPKGPSLNPAAKRLAMFVEDHPFDYRNFEGVIPAGEYGGGTVIVWDEGYYELKDAEHLSRKEQEKLLLLALDKGDLKIVFHGKKINGAFALFRMKGKGDRTWLLVKKEDKFTSTIDITQNEASVKSGKTIPEVAKQNGTEANHPEAHSKKKTTATPALKAATKTKDSIKKESNAPKKKAVSGNASNDAMPKDVIPMMATLLSEPFDNAEWLFEIKWDGYRAVAYCNESDVALRSRNLKPFTAKYGVVTEALKELKLNAVLDGEIVAINEQGFPKFQLLQNWEQTTAPLQYYVFDILWLNSYDVTKLPLTQRKELLQQVIPAGNSVIKYSDHIEGKGKQFFKAAMKQNLEGIMAKKADSIYLAKTRTPNWAKIKVAKRQEVVIAGFTKPRSSRKHFGALLLGVYDGNELKYIGHTGSGFTAKSLELVYAKLLPLITDQCPFPQKPKTNMPATWVKPKLVAELKFSEWTDEGVARHPIFMGLRTDKKAKDVVLEKATTMAKIKTASSKAITKTASKKAAVKEPAKPLKKKSETKTRAKTSGEQIDMSAAKDQSISLDGHVLQLTNLHKIYWPKEKFSKGNLINYYLEIAPYILPYLLNRPLSLNRHPNGINALNFYQKDVTGKAPEWAETFAEFSESNNESINYFVCSNEASLIYMANLGCIEMNPWHGRTTAPLNPDWCLVDLDPDDTNTFNQVMDVAHVVKKILDAIGADCCVKTSGSSGIHIYIPLGAKYDYEQSKNLAELIVNFVHAELPELTSVERSPAKRKGKIYLDFLQNRETQTAASPYSLRPKPGVPVSTPLHWTEVKKGLTQTTYTAYNIFDRLKTEGDLFKPVLGKGIDLEKVLNKMQSLL